MSIKRYSLGIVQTHATQFDGPLFKRLSQYSDIDITVYYTKLTGKAPFDKELGRSPDWDNDVMTSYCYETMGKGFFNAVRFMTKMVNGNHDLIIIGGNTPLYSCLFALCAKLNGVAAGLCSDMVSLYVPPCKIKSILKRL